VASRVSGLGRNSGNEGTELESYLQVALRYVTLRIADQWAQICARPKQLQEYEVCYGPFWKAELDDL